MNEKLNSMKQDLQGSQAVTDPTTENSHMSSLNSSALASRGLGSDVANIPAH